MTNVPRSISGTSAAGAGSPAAGSTTTAVATPSAATAATTTSSPGIRASFSADASLCFHGIPSSSGRAQVSLRALAGVFDVCVFASLSDGARIAVNRTTSSATAVANAMAAARPMSEATMAP
eukprot:CAMPEP_0174846770 /NCGR_PEP_ID=MMETSP1114-20130205/12506_1 /TAXON_ID=312471 /ORGANISM="Neobodo designis, Strain CCAP 1951/1" /LENGTH=121 /DNA_ID=CAMNT_0016081037 /DNA_START=2 /DNA_END=363 /DNA_ORIENTATION=-